LRIYFWFLSLGLIGAPESSLLFIRQICRMSYREIPEATTTDMNELQKRLDGLKREYRGVRSMTEMMEKGTPMTELQKI
jgi:hypothetical protein